MSAAALTVLGVGDWPTVSLTGEVDLSNVDELATGLYAAVDNSCHGLVLDLSGVTYLDSTGLRLLYRLMRQLEERQQQLRVVIGPGTPVHGVLVMGGLAPGRPLFPSVRQAQVHQPRPLEPGQPDREE